MEFRHAAGQSVELQYGLRRKQVETVDDGETA